LLWAFNTQYSSNAVSYTDNEKTNLWNCFADATNSEHKCWKNDELKMSTTETGPSITIGIEDFYIGCDDTSKSKCQKATVSEILIYNRRLTDDEREKVKAYFKYKWNL
jgi:hypothetical protein